MSPKHPSDLQWQPFEGVGPEELVGARDEAHWALQVISAVGYTHVQRAGDDSQSNVGWVDGMQILAGRRIEREPVSFLSLALAELTLSLHEPGGEVLEEFALAGRTLDDAYAWAAAAIARRHAEDPVELHRPEYDLPDHPIANGAPFGESSEGARAELARWFHNANLVLRDVHAATPRSTGPRVWPHHFDIGMLIPIDDDDSGRSIGLGLSPGDGKIAEPYWYVNPYPAPEGELPEPARGRRVVEGWTGLVLEAGSVRSVAEPEATSRKFLSEAIRICRDQLRG